MRNIFNAFLLFVRFSVGTFYNLNTITFVELGYLYV